LDQPYSQFLTASSPDHPDHADHADHAWCGVQASQQWQGDSLAPRSTDQEAEELEEGVEDTGESIGIERNRGKQKDMTRTQRYSEH
jgi:hypothetical protein